jgi:hypothetical protein
VTVFASWCRRIVVVDAARRLAVQRSRWDRVAAIETAQSRSNGRLIMPKNFGLGVSVRRSPVVGGRSLARLGRRELWQRLDRNMLLFGRVGARASRASEQR